MQVFIYSVGIIILDCGVIHCGTKQGKTTYITANENVENKSLLIRQKFKKTGQ